MSVGEALVNGAVVPIQRGADMGEFERWILECHIKDGDSLTLSPWPPTRSVIVVNYDGGRFRSMFRYRPGKDALLTERLESWNWDLDPSVPKESAAKLALRCICRDTGSTYRPGCPVHTPLYNERTPTPMSDQDLDEVYTGPLDTPAPPMGFASGGRITPAGAKAAREDSLVAGRDALVEAIRGIDDEIVLWWVNKAFQEAEQTVKKAREYGSAELQYAGHVIARIGGREVTKAEALELQIFHYVLGKMGRWTAAVTRGEPVNVDTPFDMGVYVRMVQYIREHGSWVD